MIKLEEKLNTLRELEKTMNLYKAKMYTRIQRGKLQELRDRMDFKLKELVEKSRYEEAVIKENAMNEMLKIMKNV